MHSDVHVTPANFSACVHCIRTFSEVSSCGFALEHEASMGRLASGCINDLRHIILLGHAKHAPMQAVPGMNLIAMLNTASTHGHSLFKVTDIPCKVIAELCWQHAYLYKVVVCV